MRAVWPWVAQVMLQVQEQLRAPERVMKEAPAWERWHVVGMRAVAESGRE